MLNPDQIIPFLTHNDSGVRKLASNYLIHAHDPSPATAEHIWKQIDAFGAGENGGSYYDLTRLPQTDASLQRTVTALKGKLSANERDHLEQVLAELKYSLLMRFSDLIDEIPNLSPKLRKHLRRRRELSSLPPTELWDRLMQLGEQMSAEDTSTDEIDRAEPGRIIEALSHSPESAGWAISTLNDPTIVDWREVYAIDLLGALRFRSAAELVLDTFVSDEEADFLIESCTQALIRMGSPQVVELIQKRFKKMNWGFRLSASDVLRCVKFPQSEAAAFELLGGENDRTVKTELAWALCELATTHPPAIERLIKMVETGDWDQEMLALDEDVGALCTILGRPKPTPTEASHQGNLSRLRGAFADSVKRPEIESNETTQLPISFDEPVEAASVRPFRRESPKVGRNDPCPCGSGKKYKKCCGK